MRVQRTLPGWLVTPQGDLGDLSSWRQRVLGFVLRALLVVGSLVALPNMVLALSKGLWLLTLVDTMALAWITLLWSRSHWPLQRRAWLFCTLLYLLGLSFLLTIGSASQIYLMAVPVMAALFLGLRPALLALGLNAVTVLGVGYLSDAHILLPGLNEQPLLKWVVLTLNFTFVSAILTLTSVVLLQGLERSLARLRDNEAWYRATFEQAPIGVSRLDLTGCWVQVNAKLCEITGYTPAELIGRPDRLLMHPQDVDFAALRQQALIEEAQDSLNTELRFIKKNGALVWVHVRTSLVRSALEAPAYFVAVITDITARKADQARINELAFYDQLTGLPNRTLMLDRLRQTLAACGRSGQFAALLYIDLDNFKRLNDTLGHDAGDQLLKQVGQRLLNCVREGDSVARLGGDEFLVMIDRLSSLPTEAAEQCERVAENILSALNQVFNLDATVHHSTLSMGVTLFNGQSLDVEELIKQADLAMYKAKSAGRNRVRFFDPAMQAAVMARAGLEDDLRHALETQQFLLHYQPQVMYDGQLTGAEVLVRWRHPQRGMVAPGDFIGAAEETGLILPLGQWVLHTACAQLAYWATQPMRAELSISVNVSAHQFRQLDFVAQVLAVLNRTGANPLRLKLELTESLLVSNVDDMVDKMAQLKQVGVSFSLDDFGTGYSSLAYLKCLPLDQLKIDQSFVRDVLTDPNDAAIAQTVVALAQSLGLGVIAEGVETAEQRNSLAAMGCHAYQGYLFSRPLPLADFEAWVQRNPYPGDAAVVLASI